MMEIAVETASTPTAGVTTIVGLGCTNETKTKKNKCQPRDHDHQEGKRYGALPRLEEQGPLRFPVTREPTVESGS